MNRKMLQKYRADAWSTSIVVSLDAEDEDEYTNENWRF